MQAVSDICAAVRGGAGTYTASKWPLQHPCAHICATSHACACNLQSHNTITAYKADRPICSIC